MERETMKVASSREIRRLQQNQQPVGANPGPAKSGHSDKSESGSCETAGSSLQKAMGDLCRDDGD
jgi:hypothetical protein